MGIHGVNVCIKYECANIKMDLSENHKIVHTYWGELVAQTCQTSHDITSCFWLATKCNQILQKKCKKWVQPAKE